jgi:hypothetical protein
MSRLLSRPWLAAGLVLLSCLIVFWPGLRGGYLFDDYPNVVSNPLVNADTLDAASLKAALRGYNTGGFGRPLATASFLVDKVRGDKSPQPFKITNLVLHAINALLVLLLLRRLLALALPQQRTELLAFALALAWAVHPLQVSTVLYIVQRMEIISLTFVLLGLLAWLRGRTRQIQGTRGWPWLAASVLLAALGLLGKETAVLFPVYVLGLELTVLGFAAANPRTATAYRALWAVAVVAATVAFVLWVVPHFSSQTYYSLRDFTVQERLLTQLRVLPTYLGWVVAPLPGHLVFYYDQLVASRSLFDPITTLLGGLFLASLLAAAVALRRRLPLFALGVFWFFGAHLLTSNVISLELAFEHRNYFALLGALLAIGALFARFTTDANRGVVRMSVAAALVALAALGMIRSATWGDPLLLASEMAASNPLSARASNDLAEQYMNLGGDNADSPFYYMAEQEFERGSRLPSASPLTEQGLLILAAAAGQTAKPEWWDRLQAKLEQRPIGPQERMAVVGLLRQREKGLPIDDRRLAQAYTLLLERHPAPAHIHAQFGDHAINRLGDAALAESLFLKATDLSADDPEFIANMVATLQGEGHEALAQAVVDRARQHGIVIR